MSVAELAERALAACGAGEALARVTRERSLLMRFADGRPTQATAVDDTDVELAVCFNGHVGRASTNRHEPEALAGCAARAAAAAEAAAGAGAGAFPGFPAPTPLGAHDGHDRATAELDSAHGGRALAEAFEVGREAGLSIHGIWTCGQVQSAVATKSGVALAERVSDAFMKVICIAPTGRSGYAARAARGVAGIDARALTERAARKAAAAGEPVALEPGDYPVVLEAPAVGLLLDMLGGTALNGLAHVEERGALHGRLGERVAAPAINLADSPRFAGTLPRGFDAEGTPKAPRPLIQDGVAMGVVHDVRSAALAGATSTGHALAPGGAPAGPHPTNLVLAGGGAAGEEELCAPIERGVLVTRLWYDNVVRPKETLFTAVTRDGTFLIEDGAVTRPLADMRITDTVLGVLARAQALSAGQELTSAGDFYGRRFATGVVCPALRASALRFSAPSG